ncbi:MAG: Fe-S cluster assembly protein SufD [Muribaculaceae bacterium]|nr:Fe-S cluster assembly protein SufD [Muribaculaceae bacterium]
MSDTRHLTQYAELYSGNAATIDANSAPALNRLRPEALRVVNSVLLPARGQEDYERTSLPEMFAPDYGVNINRLNVTADVAAAFHCGVPSMSTSLVVTVNDTVHLSKGLDRLPEGVTVESLRGAALANPEWIASVYATVADMSHPEVALNTLLAQDGILIHISRGVKLSKPLQIVNLMTGTTPVMAVRRVLIVVDEDAEGQLLVCDHSSGEVPQSLASVVTEVIVGRNARFDIYDIEESASTSNRCAATFVRQMGGSSLHIDSITLTNGATRNDFHLKVDGEHCHTFVGGMAIGSGRQHIDNHTSLVHAFPRCTSRQLFKYVLSDDSDGAFEGSIYVAPGAVHTESYQNNRNILASVGARMHSKPQLEIYCDDVKCSHGSATGQLDQEALFYMRSRGIPEREARTMLMQAFMADVIDGVRMDGLNDRLRHLVERRLSGGADKCGDCPASCQTPVK